jgi:putative membrane protein
MKKIVTIFGASALLLGGIAFGASAQMMRGFSNSAADWSGVVEHTAREEKEGKEVWEKLQAKEIACANLNDEQFGVLGEYFMGQMMGDSHAAMNAMMMQMHGEEGEEAIHIVMGKRLSGCDTSVTLPMGSGGWMPMMNMMSGRWSSPFGFSTTNNMMNFGAFGFGGIFMVLWWILIIGVIVAIVKWLTHQSQGGATNKSALDMLKERYAKGEINKQEFEERKRDLM